MSCLVLSCLVLSYFKQIALRFAAELDSDDFQFPYSFFLPCAWEYCPNAYFLRKALDVLYSDLTRGSHIPNQPEGLGSAAVPRLTYWWGVSMCPPGLNDLALAESRVTALIKKLTLMQEIAGELVLQPTLQEILEHKGVKIEPVPESTPHPTAVRYNSVIQAATLLHEPEQDDREVPVGQYTESSYQLLSTLSNPGHSNAVLNARRRRGGRRRKNKRRATYGTAYAGESSVSASASALGKEQRLWKGVSHEAGK